MSNYQEEKPIPGLQQDPQSSNLVSSNGLPSQNGEPYNICHKSGDQPKACPEDVVDFLDSSKFLHGNEWEGKELPLGPQQLQGGSQNESQNDGRSTKMAGTNEGDKISMDNNGELPMDQSGAEVPISYDGEMSTSNNEEAPNGKSKTADTQSKSSPAESPREVAPSQLTLKGSSSDESEKPISISSSSSSLSLSSSEESKKAISTQASTESKKETASNSTTLASSSPAPFRKLDNGIILRDGIDPSTLISYRMNLSHGEQSTSVRKRSLKLDPVDYSFYRPICKRDVKCTDNSPTHNNSYLHSKFLVCVPAKETLMVLENYRKRLVYYKANIDTLRLMLNEILLRKNIPQNYIDLSGLERFFFDQRNRAMCENFLENILPSVINCALDYFILLPPPLMFSPTGLNSTYSLNKRQILSILCNSFLCTFDDDLRIKVNIYVCVCVCVYINIRNCIISFFSLDWLRFAWIRYISVMRISKRLCS